VKQLTMAENDSPESWCCGSCCLFFDQGSTDCDLCTAAAAAAAAAVGGPARHQNEPKICITA
jgi:hypothetical protein